MKLVGLMVIVYLRIAVYLVINDSGKVSFASSALVVPTLSLSSPSTPSPPSLPPPSKSPPTAYRAASLIRNSPPPPKDHHRDLSIVLLQGHTGWRFFISEVPLYPKAPSSPEVLSSDDVIQDTSARFRSVEPEQWIRCHPEAGSSLSSWPKAPHIAIFSAPARKGGAANFVLVKDERWKKRRLRFGGWVSRFQVPESGFQVWSWVFWVSGSGFAVPGFWFQDPGSGCVLWRTWLHSDDYIFHA